MIVRRASHIRAIKRGRIVAQLKRRAASGAGNTSGGSDLRSGISRKEAAAIMLAQPSDENPQARGVLFDAPRRIQPPAERHWFVNASDYPGYCAACGLPRNNRRHAPRQAV